MATEKMVNPLDLATLKGLFPIWKLVSTNMRKLDAVRYAALKIKGDKEYTRLKKEAVKGVKALAAAISKYEWVEDKPVDYVPEPWVVCGRVANGQKADDCDGSAWLIQSILGGGRIILMAQMSNGKIMNFGSWHWIFVDNNNNIWSNYKLVAENADVVAWCKKKWKGCNIIGDAKADLSGIIKVQAI